MGVMDLNGVRKIYFLGIGGIGMSALARYFNEKGMNISGYDKTPSALTRTLESEGMKIQYIENVEHIETDTDLVIWTPAVPKDSILLQYTRDNGLVLKKRAEILGLLSRSHRSLAVAGTHGKTTTSSILAHLMQSGNYDCSAFLGGIAANFNSNYISGSDERLILEADEYDRSFLQLNPFRAIVTSMDPDHLDIYGTAADMRLSYLEFCRQVDKNGSLSINHDLSIWFDDWDGAEIWTYGIDKGDFQAQNVGVKEGFMVFDFCFVDICWKELKIPFPGRHNVENAIAALSIAFKEGVSEAGCREGLKTFKGIKRRFEKIFQSEEQVFIDDYAHHPSELKAAILAAREFYPQRKLTGIFQPHLYSRTQDFVDGFAEALDLLDECILLDIYPARELPIEGVTSELIFDRMSLRNKMILSKEEVINHLHSIDLDVLMTLGAGDIDRLIPKINEEIFGGIE